VAFAGPNDFWGDSVSVPTRKISLADGSILAAPASLPATIAPIEYMVSPDGVPLLAGINLLAGTDEVRLYDVTDPANPVLLDTELFPVNNTNSNGIGALDWGNGMLFALNPNNGLMAFTVVPEPTTYATIFGGLLLAGAVARRRFQK
jgi:hypothetical protein